MPVLTDAKARNVKPGSPALTHGGVTGLALHPSPTHKGQGKWVLRYTSPATGKRRNAGLGTYPAISIAEAAKQARTMRDLLAHGGDPLDAKAVASAKEPTIPGLREAAQILHKELSPGWKNPKHAQQWINTLATYAFPVLGHMPLDQVQPRNIADVLRPIWLSKPETASRLKQRLHAVMAWAWAHGYCQSNPVDVVEHLLPLQPGKTVRTQHQPAMPWSLIPTFINDHNLIAAEPDVTRQALTFLLLTAARSGEVRHMTWDEVDLQQQVWTLPAERMKAKMSHRVPLSRQAVALLKRRRGTHDRFVFATIRGHAPLTDMALTSLLRRVKAESDVVGRTATAHGFRSSFRDWCSERGYARDLAERSLAHAISNKVEAAYHRTDLLEQRRPLMQAWADFLVPTRKPTVHE